MANVAQIIRSFSCFSDGDVESRRHLLLEVFYPLQCEWPEEHDGSCASHLGANWDKTNLAVMMANGVFAERRDIYEEALGYLHSGVGNGALENIVSSSVRETWDSTRKAVAIGDTPIWE